ncbi:hypothetical protein PPK16_gp34 [Bacillus phage 049ML001]|uniref:Uncharacterized protein n=1 Tax=Bacillus phage 049ML001 TaxID=2601660 RepID=A0A5P8PHY5_9CAUD|nr:hypothetical protein PPK16_gp34 [Bacillus phage 049ML001]QFR56337.1 hypothetical protein 049ML001_34 [Bacillus phage 049ML001]
MKTLEQNLEYAMENHELKKENAELRRRNEELGKEIERQNEVIKSQNWRLLYFSLMMIAAAVFMVIDWLRG